MGCRRRKENRLRPDGTLVFIVGEVRDTPVRLVRQGGRGGQGGGRYCRGDKTFDGVTENAVRLFKYLVPDYYEDFRLSVHIWVHETLQVLFESEALPVGQPQAARLRKLYTAHVIPDELLGLWNHACTTPLTVIADGLDK